jgi:hypothetical protein
MQFVVSFMLLFATASTLAVGSTQHRVRWVPRAISPGSIRPGNEAEYSPPSSAEVKNPGT